MYAQEAGYWVPCIMSEGELIFYCRQLEQLNGALINGLEARVSQIEDKLEDLDARTSEEADNALNEREMDRFIMSGNMILLNIGFLLF